MLDHPLLSEAARHGVRLGLARMRSFLAELGSPQLVPPTVHVAGTNGKGSVVALVSAVLRAHGLRVGEMISPHLQQVNERIKVDGQPISDADLDALLVELSAATAAWARSEDLDEETRPLTYFELITAAGFVHLARVGVDASVVEVGLGGRLDATNLVQPVVTGIVTIATDHTAELGPDLASIAAEKAGIIKPGVPVVVGPLPPDAVRVVRSMAASQQAPLLAPGDGYRVVVDREGAACFSLDGLTLPDLHTGLPGEHQQDNLGVALALCALFLERAEGGPRRLDPELTAQAVASVQHPGRLEWVADDLLLDSAHNPAGAATVADYLRALPWDQPRTLLLGVSDDKDARSMVVALEGVVDRVVTTNCRHPRAMQAGALAEALVGVRVPVLPAGPVEDALPLARNKGGLVVVAGSIFLAGAVRELVGAR